MVNVEIHMLSVRLVIYLYYHLLDNFVFYNFCLKTFFCITSKKRDINAEATCFKRKNHILLKVYTLLVL